MTGDVLACHERHVRIHQVILRSRSDAPWVVGMTAVGTSLRSACSRISPSPPHRPAAHFSLPFVVFLSAETVPFKLMVRRLAAK
jgi:hypothetical protein